MQFSILIPTYRNFDYLKLTILSIKKNSFFKHEIIVHINGYDKITEKFLKEQKIKYTKSKNNIGLCSGVNKAYQISTSDYIVYSHDDMYFLPEWDFFLINEIKSLKHYFFYLSSTQMSHIPKKNNSKDLPNHIHLDAGNSIDTFNENKLLKNFKKKKFYDLQGSHWAPHVIHRILWDKIGGFSKEFDPGFASDPDLNMKLWCEGVRIFKCVNKSRIYHFGSLTTRKNKNVVRNNGKKTFLLKWGITLEHFIKFYMKRGMIYKKPLAIDKNIDYYLSLLSSKIQYITKFFTF